MKRTMFHPFHLVTVSPWPLITSLSVFLMLSGIALWFYSKNYLLIVLGFAITLVSSILWWRDVIRESTFQGSHTNTVQVSMKLGMALFIVSEIMFFFSFFWAFLHSSLSPNIELGANWPPTGIYALNPMEIPFLNTAVLLGSSVSVTWSHHALMHNSQKEAVNSLIMTLVLGFYFTMLQVMEYFETSFSIADSAFGGSFFVTTGFHGLHVIIGSLFLFTMLARMVNFHFSKAHHFGFEASIWYWHFVDIVWLFVYSLIYWWGT